MFAYKYLKVSAVVLISFALLLLAVYMTRQPKSMRSKQPEKSHIVSSSDTAKIEKLLREARMARDTDPDSAMSIFRHALNESIRIRYNDGAVSALLGLARREAEQGNFPACYNYFMQAGPYADSPVYNRSLKAGYLGTFASHYYLMQGDYLKGNELYFKALTDLHSKNIYNAETIPKIYFNLSLNFSDIRQFDKAFEYLMLGEAVARRYHHTEALVQILTNYGRVYFMTGSFKQAETKFNEAMELLPNTKDLHTKVNLLMSMADFFTKSGKPARAIPYLQETLQLSSASGMTSVKISAQLLLARAYNGLERFREAETLAKLALDTAIHSNLSRSYVGCYSMLFKSLKGQGRYKEALAYHELQDSLAEKLLDSSKALAMNRMEVKYRTAAKDHEIASKALMIARQENKLFRKNMLIYGIFTVFAVLSFFVYRTATHMRLLHAQQISSLQKEKHILSLQSHIDGEEKERKRIARELHDGIANMLSTLRIHLGALSVSNGLLSSEPNYQAAMELVDEAGREVRRTSNNLMPEVLLNLGLVEAIEQYCTYVLKASAINVTIQSYGEARQFGYKLRLTVYRIVQELVHNIIKHSNATEAVVQLMYDVEVLTITVEDNGRGFDKDKETNGLGLSNIRARVGSLQGEFSLESSAENGTSIYIVLPIRIIGNEDTNNNNG